MKILLPFLLLVSCLANPSAITHVLLQDKLQIALPSELKQLSPTALDKRYGGQKRPPAFAFSNQDQDVSVTFTRYATVANKRDMRKIHKSVSDMLRAANPKVSWKKDKLYNRFDTKVAVYEYEIKGKSQYQYNLTYALPVDKQLTFIHVVITNKKYKKKWLALVHDSLNSIQFLF